MADLRNLASTCEFSTIQDALLLTQFIIGIDNSKLHGKFLTKVDLNFTQSIQEALLNEESYNTSTAIATPSINGNDLKLTSSTAHPTMESSSHSLCALTKHYTSNARPGWKRNAPKNTPNQGACKSCGQAHSRATYKFRNVKYYNCQCVGHIASACKSDSSSSSLGTLSGSDVGYHVFETDPVTCLPQNSHCTATSSQCQSLHEVQSLSSSLSFPFDLSF